MSAVVALRLALLQTIGARVAFFDEPTSGLDPVNANKIKSIISDFNRNIQSMMADGSYNEILELNWIKTDVDGDGHGSACDCNDTNPLSWRTDWFFYDEDKFFDKWGKGMAIIRKFKRIVGYELCFLQG